MSEKTSTTVTVRFVLSVAVPEHGIGGGLRELHAEERGLRRDELPACVSELHDWATDVLTREEAPLGLYVATCVLLAAVDDLDDAADEEEAADEEWLAEESIAWDLNGPWPMGGWRSPALSAEVA